MPLLMRKMGQLPRVHRLAAALTIIAVLQATEACAADKLLDEVLQFTGAALFLETKVPALVIGGVRNGETALAGFGKTSAEADRPPDGKTLLRIGSISKPFTGAVLASLVADNPQVWYRLCLPCRTSEVLHFRKATISMARRFPTCPPHR